LNRDRLIGAVILLGSAVGIVGYSWLLYAFTTVVLQMTAFIAVAAILSILAWIGWTMATTPPPIPIETAQTSASAGASIEQQEKGSEGKS